MAKFKNIKTGAILETNSKEMIEQYEKYPSTYESVKKGSTSKGEKNEKVDAQKDEEGGDGRK